MKYIAMPIIQKVGRDIDPFESYRSVFNGQIDILSNPELILAGVEILEGKVSGIWWFTSYHLPLPDGIQSGLTQKIVDAYYMNDGSNCPGMNSEYANVPRI